MLYSIVRILSLCRSFISQCWIYLPSDRRNRSILIKLQRACSDRACPCNPHQQPNFMKHPAYAPPPPSNKPQMHQHGVSSIGSTLVSTSSDHVTKTPFLKWIQQVNNSSSINGLIHPSQNQGHHNGGGGGGGVHRSQHQVYPYGSYISTGPGKISFSSYGHRMRFFRS